MVHSCRYALMKFDTRSPRDERLNVGVVVTDGQELRVHLPRSLRKVHAITAAFDETLFRKSASELPSTFKWICENGGDTDRCFHDLAEYSPFEFAAAGEMIVESAEAYDRQIVSLLCRFVDPEPAPPKRKEKSSPLLSTLKREFRKERVLAQKGDDLTAHRVITSLPLAEGFSADLVLKNGAMHVTQTVDASNPEASLRRIVQDIAVSALTIEQARIVFADEETKGRIVYRASSKAESAATPALDAAEHQGIELINWDSFVDRERFVRLISSLAEPIQKKSRNTNLMIHASNQHRLKLN